MPSFATSSKGPGRHLSRKGVTGTVEKKRSNVRAPTREAAGRKAGIHRGRRTEGESTVADMTKAMSRDEPGGVYVEGAGREAKSPQKVKEGKRSVLKMG